MEVVHFGYPLGYPLKEIPVVLIRAGAASVYGKLGNEVTPDYYVVRAAFGVPRQHSARLTPRTAFTGRQRVGVGVQN